MSLGKKTGSCIFINLLEKVSSIMTMLSGQIVWEGSG